MAEYIIFYGNRVSDIRIQDDKVNTLQARMGTGGNNMPLVATTVRFRGGKPGGGKGPLLAEGISQVLTTPNDQILFDSNVRRLTPVECERLQGFPDNWTEGQADSHRYKQMGNAVAVPVVEWIIQNICDTL
jgi:DNA (cytosine-5)-methyltransferase 1